MPTRMLSLALLPLLAPLAAAPARAALRGDQILCAVDRPCLDEATARGGAIVLHWHADQAWDRFVIRWSAPDQPEAQATIRAVHQEGAYEIPRARPGVAYAIRIQGCRGTRTCSPDEAQTVAAVSLAGLCPADLAARRSETCLPALAPPSQAAAKDDRLAEKHFTLRGALD